MNGDWRTRERARPNNSFGVQQLSYKDTTTLDSSGFRAAGRPQSGGLDMRRPKLSSKSLSYGNKKYMLK